MIDLRPCADAWLWRAEWARERSRRVAAELRTDRRRVHGNKKNHGYGAAEPTTSGRRIGPHYPGATA